ncbi:MAG: oligogalacturonate lyase family protein, partial [Bacteroidota bacterium]|nr:oligogalacturonate lyase family protein [Bacteroidota bacterium]
KDTHHKIICLSRIEGNSLSFYFHNNPFLQQSSNEGDRMVFYNTGTNGKQGYTVNLKTLKIERITNQNAPMTGEIVGHKSHNIYYQKKDSVFVSNIDTKKTRLVFVFPADFKASISTLNADETMLAGGWAADEQKEILRKYPEKSQFFNRIFDAHALNKLFTINIKTGELKKIHEEKTWLGHIQFSPTIPDLLMFCHEGPWQKVDRIWTIDIKTGQVQLMHKRTVDNEIAGHEFFSSDGKTIWFDDQVPRSENFFLTGSNVKDHSEKHYRMTRDEWSIHFNVNRDQTLFAGDGGDPGQVAKAKDGMWIYLFRPKGDHFDAEKLVNMKYHNYKLEPNVHFSPDGKWIIFRANFEGVEKVYAVEIAKTVQK